MVCVCVFCNVLLFFDEKKSRLSKEATRLFWGELLIVTSLPNVILLLKFHWVSLVPKPLMPCILNAGFTLVFDTFFDTFLAHLVLFFRLGKKTGSTAGCGKVWVVKPHGCPHS